MTRTIGWVAAIDIDQAARGGGRRRRRGRVGGRRVSRQVARIGRVVSVIVELGVRG